MKLIKWLLWVVLFVVVIAIGAAVFLVVKVDPNDLKPQISQKVESLTGRKLTLGGDLDWRFYPWVGVTLNDFSLSNRDGFAPENMLQATQVDVQIKLLPLINKQLEIGKIILQSPKINLSVNAQGVTNWDDLSGDSTSAPAIDKPEQAAGAMLGGLVVQGVDISDGEISWDDQAAGQRYQLSGFNISTGAIESGAPVEFNMSSAVSGTDLPAEAQVELSGSLLLSAAMDALQLEGLTTRVSMDETQAELELGTLKFSLADGTLDIDALSAELEMDQINAKFDIKALTYVLESQMAKVGTLRYSGQYEAYPAEGEISDIVFDVSSNTLTVAKHVLSSQYNDIALALSGTQLQLNLGEETLVLPELSVKADDASIKINFKARQIMGDIQADGHIVSNAFKPKGLAAKLGVDALSDMPEQAMQSMALETNFSGSLSSVALNNMKIELDNSTLVGEFSIQDFEKPAYRFDLDLDQINVDDYVSDGSSSDTQKPKADESTAPEESLAQNSDSAQATSNNSAGPAAAAAALPYEELKGLDVQGEIRIAELRMQDLLTNDVRIKIGAEADRIEISPLSARVYGGETVNTVVYDISADVPKAEISSKLLSLDMGSFLQAMQITDRFEGFGSMTAALSSSGLMTEDVVSNLNGEIDITLSDGAIRGVDIQASLIKAEALLSKLSGQELGLGADLGDKTEFSEFGTNIVINRGVMTIQSINLKAPAIRLTGGGQVDLNTEQLDLNLDVSIVGSFEGQGGASLDKLKGQTIPLKITGSMDDPSILPDLSKLFQKELERKLTEKYLGEGESGESFNDALNRKLNEQLEKELGQEPAATTAGTSAEGATADEVVEPAPTEAAEEPLTDKQKARKALKKEGAKLLKGLFGG